jgi:hypothetical protein
MGIFPTEGRDTTCNKAKLIAKLEDNRRKHTETFKAAWRAFKDEVVIRLGEFQCEIGAAAEFSKIVQPDPLPAPQDHTLDYDRAIDRLKWETADQVTLSEGDFLCYVRDEWTWRKTFDANSRRYTG